MTVYRLYQGSLYFQNVVLLHSTTFPAQILVLLHSTTFPAQILTMQMGSIHLITVTQYTLQKSAAVPSFSNLVADTRPETEEQGLQLRLFFFKLHTLTDLLTN